MAETLNIIDIKKETRHIRIDGVDFDVELVYDPHDAAARTRRDLAKRIGARRQKDEKVCLDITEEDAKNAIKHQDYSVIGFARNRAVADEASGTLQLYSWCKGATKPQLWINDLCRITGEGVAKPKTSPLKALMRVFEDIGRAAGLAEIYLLVENKEPEKSVLPEIYKKYGFKIVKFCELAGDDSIIMWKKLTRPKSRRKTRVRSAPGPRSTRKFY